jgi:2-polyprenyl-3-methyl-5-hydroxy-6-metoxy-1,4-benzoquinol methylase
MNNKKFTERAACPMCKSKETDELCSLPYINNNVLSFLRTYYKNSVDESYVEEAHYSIQQCRSCKSCYQKEILNTEGMKLLYGKWISSEGSKAKVVHVPRQVEIARHIARILLLFPDPSKARLLDYGMGWGDWCHMAQSFGFNACGVELDQERIAFAKNRGIQAYLPDDLPKEQYDFIYLEQVLEHLPEPHETIEKLVNTMSPNGYMHIGVPNGKSIPIDAQKNPLSLIRKGPAHPLEHINIFSHGSLIAFMKQFNCYPVQQKEGFLRCTKTSLLLRDATLMAARMLPASIFPHKTNLLFQKRS